MLQNPAKRAKLRSTLIIITLATLPCYLIGMIVIWVGNSIENRPTATPSDAEFTPSAQWGLLPTNTLPPIPTSPAFDTATPTITLTPTVTNTFAIPTDTPTLSPTPSSTPTFTPTTMDTETPTPTATETSEPSG